MPQSRRLNNGIVPYARLDTRVDFPSLTSVHIVVKPRIKIRFIRRNSTASTMRLALARFVNPTKLTGKVGLFKFMRLVLNDNSVNCLVQYHRGLRGGIYLNLGD